MLMMVLVVLQVPPVGQPWWQEQCLLCQDP
jgi:hypothetical protein